MRVSNSQIYNMANRYLEQTSTAYFNANEQVSSGKRINRPSDDPNGAGRVTRYRADLSRLAQYQENISHARTFLNQTESTLNLINSLRVSAKEIALQGANGNHSSTELDNMAQSIATIKSQLVSLANTQVGDEYIFGGYDVSSPPYDSSGNYSGDDGEIEIRIGKNSTIKLNFPGENVLGAAGGVDLFQTLTDLQTALSGNDLSGIQTSIGNLDASEEQIMSAWSITGYRVNNLDGASNVLDQINLDTTELISDTEDVDMSQAMMNFSKQEVALQAVMASSAKILQTNLLNFLK